MATIKDRHSELRVDYRGDYQMEGVKWMLGRELDARGTPKGGILADDMGLGKTFMSTAVCVGNPTMTLIIAPSSVLSQWRDALAKYGGLEPFFISSATDLKGLGTSRMDNLVVGCAYNIAIMAKVRNALTKMQWGRVILDEGHAIKNTDTQVGKQCLAAFKHCTEFAAGPVRALRCTIALSDRARPVLYSRACRASRRPVTSRLISAGSSQAPPSRTTSRSSSPSSAGSG
jgi:hypothetical protein